MLWTLPLLLAPGFGAPLHENEAQATAQDAAQAKPPTMAESLEVLAKLLVRELNAAPAQNPAHGNLVWPTLSSAEMGGVLTQAYINSATNLGGWSATGTSSRADNARGFHLPGAGATFTIDVKVPVHVTMPTRPAATDGPDDAQKEWDEILRSLRTDEEQADAAETPSQPDYFALYGSYLGADEPQAKLDPAAVDAAIGALLDTLAKHGRRLELGEDEAITVALTAKGVDPVQSAWLSTIDPAVPTTDLSEQWVQYSYILNAGQTKPESIVEHIVVRVSRSALEKGFDSGDDLRGHAQIHRY